MSLYLISPKPYSRSRLHTFIPIIAFITCHIPKVVPAYIKPIDCMTMTYGMKTQEWEVELVREREAVKAATGYIDPSQFSDDREGEIAARDEYVGKIIPLDEAKHEAFRLARFTMKNVTIDVKIKGQDDDMEIVRPEVRAA